MSAPRLVIVTGANRGIGQAICQRILSRPDLTFIKLLATSRKGEDLGLNTSNEKSEILYPRLDISNQDSINAFRDEVKRHGDVSVLINNAGVNLDAQYGPESVKQTLDVNFRGTVNMCQAFLPHLTPTGRIVNLVSVASQIKSYSPEIQDRFRSPSTTLEDLEHLAQAFQHAVETRTEVSAGFGEPTRSYSVSKALMRAATAILSRSRTSASQLVNCCCPGWVRTDMGALIGRPPKTPEEGSLIPVRLAFDDIGDVSGEYWANDSVRSREAGKVQEW